MKRTYSSLFVLSSAFLIFAGCAKESTTKVNTASNANTQSIIASDELTLNDEFNQAADDAVKVICNHNATITGADVDTSQINLGVITIYYFGNEPDGTKKRTGSDSIHQNLVGGKIVPWGTPGTTASMTFGCLNAPGYEVLYLTNNTSLSLNGTAKLINVSGGYLQNIAGGDSLVEKIKATVSFTYNDNATTVQLYAWGVNQLRTFTKSDSTIYAGARGDTTINNISNIGTWGTDRYGDSYNSCITASIVQNVSNLSLSYNPLSGAKTIIGIPEPIQSIYGTDKQGNFTSSSTPYGFKITWINNGGQAQVVVGYYY